MAENQPDKRQESRARLYGLPQHEDASDTGKDDQVPRLRRFRAEHSEIEIIPPSEYTRGFWIARKEGEAKPVASSPLLSGLLDELESF